MTLVMNPANQALKVSGFTVEDDLYELCTGTLQRIEVQHILRELKRTKANTKKIILIALEYGDCDEYLTKKQMELFHSFILQLDVNDLSNPPAPHQYFSNKYKAEYLDMMEIISDEY